MLLRKESGLSLIEMTIGIGMLGIGALAFLKMSESMSKRTTTSAVQSELSFVREKIKSVLKSDSACVATLTNKGLLPFSSSNFNSSSLSQPFALSNIYDSSGDIVFKKGEDLGHKDLVLNDVSFHKKTGVSDRGIINFKIDNKAVSNNRGYGGKNLNIKYELFLSFNGPQLEACNLLADLDEADNCVGPGVIWDANSRECLTMGVAPENCPAGQVLARSSINFNTGLVKFHCQNIASFVPDCAPGEVLTKNPKTPLPAGEAPFSCEKIDIAKFIEPNPPSTGCNTVGANVIENIGLSINAQGKLEVNCSVCSPPACQWSLEKEYCEETYTVNSQNGASGHCYTGNTVKHRKHTPSTNCGYSVNCVGPSKVIQFDNKCEGLRLQQVQDKNGPCFI